jgi:hypothetical protein
VNSRTCPPIEAADTRRRNYKGEKTKIPDHGSKRKANFIHCVVPGQSFATVLRSNPVQHGQRRPAAQIQPTPAEETQTSPPPQQQRTSPTNLGQSVQAPIVNSLTTGMLKVVTVVEQIMTELNEAVSEEEKIVAVTKL